MIYYVRHGQTEDNLNKVSTGRNDISLTDIGIKQAKEVGETLKKVKFDMCFVSPLKRAKQTLEHILPYHEGLKPIVDDRLIERNYGEIQGLYYKDKRVDQEEYKHRYDLLHESEIKGMETVKEMCDRVHSFFSYLKENHKNKNILIVAHGGIGRVVNCCFEGYPKSLNLCEVKNIDNVGYKVFCFEE